MNEMFESHNYEYPRVLGFTIAREVICQLNENDSSTNLDVDSVIDGDYPQRFKDEVQKGWNKSRKKFEEHYK